MPTFDQVLVTGNQTILGQLQVVGNSTIGNLDIAGSMSIWGGGMFVDDNATIQGNLGAGLNLSAGQNVVAGSRLMSVGTPTVPPVAASTVSTRFYPATLPTQPGLMLKGTDGLNYMIIVDTSSGLPTLAIHGA
ncbi:MULTISPECIES: hypothetical protein [unclassified Paenibacillus]|uniref:hypothetical protein n=1 Tax=unclassified Paenibacillus TaxID=185978 RepID=UPI000896438F|nr:MULTISPECIES: hypothetical protein [unclassified Paenibacillus]OMC71955.1 hypothetical protein BK126_07995 [Paenibacillus sp. FSL H7-0326]SDX31899.1 hypothetical protein SAMN05518848_106174 [Paenibacillus sp. PDC88]